MNLPSAFTAMPDVLKICNEKSSDDEIAAANAVRAEYLIKDQSAPHMVDVVRAFRLAANASVYIEVGSQDKGNIAWVARTKLKPGATIIDIDLLDYPDNDKKIHAELLDNFDYHQIRGNCLSDKVLEELRSILNGRKADFIFCDSHYTFEHTLEEFGLYFPLVKTGGFLVFHDAQWPGDANGQWDEIKKRERG